MGWFKKLFIKKSACGEKFEWSVKVKCDRCGHIKIVKNGLPMGIDLDRGEEFWGDHNCGNGELGTYWMEDYLNEKTAEEQAKINTSILH